ncbi:MAG: ABC transporter substrate-binding protein [Sphaerochaetaceae bacterium]
MKRPLMILIIMALVCAFAFSGASKEEAPKQEKPAADAENLKYSGTVMLYSSTGEDVILAFKDAFESKYPNVKLDYYSATSGKCVTKLATEFQSGMVTCDVAWLADPSAMISLKRENHLIAYNSPYANGVSLKFKDADGYYCGARLLLMGMTYSTIACTENEAPYNYDEVLTPNFKNQIVLTDPTGSGSTKALVYALVNDSRYGWSYFEKLKANGAELKSSSGDTNNSIATGSYKVGFGVDYNTKNLIAKGSPLGWHDTKDIVAVPCPIGIPAGAPHEELAKLLYDFILDPNGGQPLMTKYNICPVVDGVELPAGMLTATAISEKALPIDWNDLAKVSKDLLNKFDSIFKK